MANHTPGPWKTGVDEYGSNFWCKGENDRLVIGGCGCCGSPFMDPKTAYEDACLIEAAPDMLEALRQCTSPIAGFAVKDAAQAQEVLSNFLDHIQKVDAIARAAIAKAEGKAE